MDHLDRHEEDAGGWKLTLFVSTWTLDSDKSEVTCNYLLVNMTLEGTYKMESENQHSSLQN